MANILNLFKTKKEKAPSFKYHHHLNSLPAHIVHGMVYQSESDSLLKILPNISHKTVLYLNDQNHERAYKKILAKKPKDLINYVYGGPVPGNQVPHSYTVMGNLESLSMTEEYCDVVILPLGQRSDRFAEATLSKVNPIIRNGGRLILSVRHPEWEHFLYNQNPAERCVMDNLLSKFFKILKKHDLYVEDMIEGCVNSSFKKYFQKEGEFDYYLDYKGLPISTAFCAVKYKK